MKNLEFERIRVNNPNRNKFDLTHDFKFTSKFGELTPILALECLPGDSFDLAADSMVRFAPLIAPPMHRSDVYIHYWFVPNRVLWPNWETFLKDETTGGIPQITIDGTQSAAQQRFLEYFGIPKWSNAGATSSALVNALPLAAYQKIYDEWYRPQKLENANFTVLADGVQNPAMTTVLTTMRKRSYEHDYFNSAMPEPQEGVPVEIGTGIVELDPDWNTNGATPALKTAAGVVPDGDVRSGEAVGNLWVDGPVSDPPVAYDPDGSLITNTIDVRELRRRVRLQEWLEKLMRGGERYVEMLWTFFQVRSSDKRLQRPEYITGTKAPVIISEVLNTTGTSGELPQGNMAGHAISVGDGNRGRYYCEEHGYIIGIMSVLPLPAYMQGIPKHFLKSDPIEDYAWPDFAHIGEQEIKNAELYAYGAAPSGTFGYIPRYSEYKYMPNRVAGEFTGSLDYWHMAVEYGAQPVLNAEFVQCDHADVDRIFAVTDPDVDKLYCVVLNKINAYRKLPVYSDPHL